MCSGTLSQCSSRSSGHALNQCMHITWEAACSQVHCGTVVQDTSNTSKWHTRTQQCLWAVISSQRQILFHHMYTYKVCILLCYSKVAAIICKYASTSQHQMQTHASSRHCNECCTRALKAPIVMQLKHQFLGWYKMTTSSSAIAEKPRCSVGQFWVAITPYSADRPVSIKSNQIEIIDWLSEAS